MKNWRKNNPSKVKKITKKSNEQQKDKIKEWRKNNPAKIALYRRKAHPNLVSYNKNKTCALYLGVHVAEKVLSRVFKDVNKMQMHNRGFDFICNKGQKIDVKSSCMYNEIGRNKRWMFSICYNTIPDYFLCLAFDNRNDLNPLYMWLIPGININMNTNVSISITTLQKWDKYKLKIDDVINCCNKTKN